MTPRRRQPPLLEALGGVARDGRDASRGSSSPVVHPAAPGSDGRPSVIVEPRPSRAAPAAGAPGPVQAWWRQRSSVIMFLIAGLVLMFAIVWPLAYRLGEDRGKRSMLAHTERPDAAAITGQNPSGTPAEALPPSKAAPPVVTTPRQAPPPTKGAAPAGAASPAPAGMPPIVGADRRKAGFNYLEVVELTWRDAEPAIRFLQANGIRASGFPSDKKVDPARLQPNNRVRVYVDQPFGSGEAFRASQTERNTLVAEIRRLGKIWQTQHRGASDFQEPFWRLQRGK